MSYGVIDLVWHQVTSLGGISHPNILVYVMVMLEFIGGLTLQFRRTSKIGAVVLCVVFLVFSLYLLPPILQTPLVFAPWGNFFEEFSILVGGFLVLASTVLSDRKIAAKVEQVAYISFGICVVTYALYQLLYLTYTASLVPKWIPPGEMFWAIATTIAFALAAIAVLSNHSALLASWLLTAMLTLFGLLIWVPACIIHPHTLDNWTENAQNLSIAGTAWIAAEYLSKRKSTKPVL